MTKSLIPSFFLPNLFISFLLMFLVVLVLFILSHLDRTSSPPRLRNASSWDTLDFRRAIVVIPLTLIVIFSLLMSPSLRTLHSSHALNLFPFLKYCHFSIYPPLQMRSLVLFRFIIVDIVLLLLLSIQLRYLMTHLLSHRFFLPRSYHLLTICLLLFGKVIDLLVILILFIIFELPSIIFILFCLCLYFILCFSS